MAKKICKYTLVSFGVLLSVCLFAYVIFFSVAYHIRLNQMWNQFDASVMPNEAGKSWETEDGFLSYTNGNLVSREVILSGRTQTLYYYDRPGFVRVGAKEISVQISFSQEDAPRMHITLNEENEESQEPQPFTNAECIEIWVATDFYETDDEIIFILEVEETTYYEVGQEIRLVYKKK